jgi:hypothetical protein
VAVAAAAAAALLYGTGGDRLSWVRMPANGAQWVTIVYGIHQIAIRNYTGFCYLCPQLAYLVLSAIFLIASKIGESLGSYQVKIATNEKNS